VVDLAGAAVAPGAAETSAAEERLSHTNLTSMNSHQHPDNYWLLQQPSCEFAGSAAVTASAGGAGGAYVNEDDEIHPDMVPND